MSGMLPADKFHCAVDHAQLVLVDATQTPLQVLNALQWHKSGRKLAALLPTEAGSAPEIIWMAKDVSENSAHKKFTAVVIRDTGGLHALLAGIPNMKWVYEFLASSSPVNLYLDIEILYATADDASEQWPADRNALLHELFAVFIPALCGVHITSFAALDASRVLTDKGGVYKASLHVSTPALSFANTGVLKTTVIQPFIRHCSKSPAITALRTLRCTPKRPERPMVLDTSGGEGGQNNNNNPEDAGIGVDDSPYGVTQCFRTHGSAKSTDHSQTPFTPVMDLPAPFTNLCAPDMPPPEQAAAALVGRYAWTPAAQRHFGAAAAPPVNQPTLAFAGGSGNERKRKTDGTDARAAKRGKKNAACLPPKKAPGDIYRVVKKVLEVHSSKADGYKDWCVMLQALKNEIGEPEDALAAAVEISLRADKFEGAERVRLMLDSLTQRNPQETKALSMGTLVMLADKHPALVLRPPLGAPPPPSAEAFLTCVDPAKSDPAFVVRALKHRFRVSDTETAVAAVCNAFAGAENPRATHARLAACHANPHDPGEHGRRAICAIVNEAMGVSSDTTSDGVALWAGVGGGGGGGESDSCGGDGSDGMSDAETDEAVANSPPETQRLGDSGSGGSTGSGGRRVDRDLGELGGVVALATIFTSISLTPTPPPTVFSACRTLLGAAASSFIKAWANTAPDPEAVRLAAAAAASPPTAGANPLDNTHQALDDKHHDALALALRYASENPAVTMHCAVGSNATTTVDTFLANCTLKKSSWAAIAAAGAALFPGADERRRVSDALAAFRKRMEQVPDANTAEACAAICRRVPKAAKCALFNEAHCSSILSKCRGLDRMMDGVREQFKVNRVFDSVYPTVAIEGAAGHERLMMWAEDEHSHVVPRAYSVELRTMATTRCSDLEPVEHAFWAASYMDEFTERGPYSLGTFIGTRIPNQAPFRYDHEEHEWRFFSEQLGIWIKRKSHIVGAEDTRRDAEAGLSSILRTVFQPLRDAAGFLVSHCALSEDERLKGTKTEVEHALREAKNNILAYTECPRNVQAVLARLEKFPAMCSHFNAQPPHLVVFRNGVFDFRRGELIDVATADPVWVRAQGFIEEQYVDCQHISSFTQEQLGAMGSFLCEHMTPAEVYGEDGSAIVRALQLYLGYSLTGETNLQVSWNNLGRGSNMKSILAKMLTRCLGKHFVGVLSAKDLKVKAGENNDAVYNNRRKRMWLVTESARGCEWDDELFKSSVGGDESRSVAAKYKGAAEYVPVAKITTFMNSLPVWKEIDFAVKRRYVVFDMKVSYAKDEQEREDLVQEGVDPRYIRDADSSFMENEMMPRKDVFVAWLVQGAVDYYKAGRKVEFPACLTQREQLTRESDIEGLIQEYAAHCFEPTEKKVMPFDWIYTTFQDWASTRTSGGRVEVSATKLGALFKSALRGTAPNATFTSSLWFNIGNEKDRRHKYGFRGLFWSKEFQEEAGGELQKSDYWRIKQNRCV